MQIFFMFLSIMIPKKIQNYLLKKNILIKGGPGVNEFEEYLRISYAKKSTISLILNEIKKYLKMNLD